MTQPVVGAQCSWSETPVDLSLFRLLSISFGTKPKPRQQEEAVCLYSVGRFTTACVPPCELHRHTNCRVRTHFRQLFHWSSHVIAWLQRKWPVAVLHPPPSHDWVHVSTSCFNWKYKDIIKQGQYYSIQDTDHTKYKDKVCEPFSCLFGLTVIAVMQQPQWINLTWATEENPHKRTQLWSRTSVTSSFSSIHTST